MKKEIINPETGDWADHETAYSEGVVVHMPGHKRVMLSGIVSEGDDIETQTRKTFKKIKNILEDVGGGMKDIVRVRIFINGSMMNEENLEAVHDVRGEFFIADHYPASTLVEIKNLVSDEFYIEIDTDATIPYDGWEVETLSDFPST